MPSIHHTKSDELLKWLRLTQVLSTFTNSLQSPNTPPLLTKEAQHQSAHGPHPPMSIQKHSAASAMSDSWSSHSPRSTHTTPFIIPATSLSARGTSSLTSPASGPSSNRFLNIPHETHPTENLYSFHCASLCYRVTL